MRRCMSEKTLNYIISFCGRYVRNEIKLKNQGNIKTQEAMSTNSPGTKLALSYEEEGKEQPIGSKLTW